MTSQTVYIVDDDPGIRFSVAALLRTAGLACVCFDGAEEFLNACSNAMDGCLVLDVRLTGMSGPELQEELLRRKIRLPIIFLTGYADLPTGLQALKQGAVDFLTKPVNGSQLLECITIALTLGQAQRQIDAARQQFEASINRLTPREREILTMALSGMSNKIISSQLGISARTIEGHRSRILLKTGAASLLEVAQQAANANIGIAEIPSICADADTSPLAS